MSAGPTAPMSKSVGQCTAPAWSFGHDSRLRSCLSTPAPLTSPLCVLILSCVHGSIRIKHLKRHNCMLTYVDAAELEALLKIEKVMLVNDFLASGYGLLTLGRQDVCKEAARTCGHRNGHLYEG